MIKKFRKKPVVIKAIQWNGENELGVMDFFGGRLKVNKPPRMAEIEKDLPNNAWELYIPTLEDGTNGQVAHVANKMDWIIKGVNGEFYPCKPDIFEKTYEPA